MIIFRGLMYKNKKKLKIRKPKRKRKLTNDDISIYLQDVKNRTTLSDVKIT